MDSCLTCGAKYPQGFKGEVLCKCKRMASKERTPSYRIITNQDFSCLYRSDSLGIINCGCAGKHDAYWCELLQGHCTTHSTGKWWDKFTTDSGETIKRVGKLQPCFMCDHRTDPPKYRYKPTPPEPIKPTSRRAVCTIVIGESAERNHALAGQSHKAYADRHGADYVVLRGATQDMVVYEKHRYKSVVEQYPEGTLCLDASDTFVMPDAPSIWDEVPDGCVALSADHKAPGTQSLVQWGATQIDIMAKLNQVEPIQAAKETYHNSGVWFGRPEQAVYWTPPPIGFAGHWCDEETWCRLQMHRLGLRLYQLDEKWNYCWSNDRGLTRINEVRPWIVHLAGMDNPSVPEGWKLNTAETRTALLRVMAYFGFYCAPSGWPIKLRETSSPSWGTW